MKAIAHSILSPVSPGWRGPTLLPLALLLALSAIPFRGSMADHGLRSAAAPPATQCGKDLPNGLGVNAQCVPHISNIEKLLNTCPASDPATATILGDFEIRHDNARVKAFPCHQPVSKLPLAAYTDELFLIQALRVIYYMDRGRSGHLPWTTGTIDA